MVFNSYNFLIFFPVVVLVYFIIPAKARRFWLLISSYYFYMSWNAKYLLLILTTTIITYYSSILIHKASSNKKRKTILASAILINCLILGFFKYIGFFLDSIDFVSRNLFSVDLTWRPDILLPVGISFYTFQTIGYVIDVYKGKIEPEKNIITYALFVSFFPQLVAGPIERSGNLMGQIRNVDTLKLWNYDRVRDGFLLMMWGLFQKLVIADRVSVAVKEAYTQYESYGAVELVFATLLFALQILCDFGGYTSIARGAARVMGFELMENFRQPYLATGIQDFWRRWHISLTTWFTDYLYIPLGGNRKGTLRKYLNTIIVFLVSGLWHGAGWNYVIWGGIHGVYLICADVKKKIENKLSYSPSNSFSCRLRKRIGTFAMVCFAWIFFASDSVTSAFGIIRRMLTTPTGNGISELGLSQIDLKILAISVSMLLIVDVIKERGGVLGRIYGSQERWFRMLSLLGLIWFIIMLGAYGTGYNPAEFIYFRF